MPMFDKELNLDDEELEVTSQSPQYEEDFEEEKEILPDPLEEITKTTEKTDNTVSEEDDVEEDLVTTLLRSKGINPSAVKFLNDKGEEEELDFSSLSREEQLEVLNYTEDFQNLDEDEIGLLNSIREKDLSVNEYIDYIKNNAIQEYINSIQTTTYEVDSYSDDELYILDKKSRIPDLSDEDAQLALEHAKSNTILFEKEIAGLRSEYKKLEEQKVKEQEDQDRLTYEESMKAYEEAITNAIVENSEIDLGDTVLSLSEDDMQEVASFILDSDAAGIRYIQKALSDPKTLVQMSWFALKGQEIFSQISDYYKKEIKEVGQYNFKRGLEEGSKKLAKKATTVVSKSKPKTENNPQFLDFDDE